MSLTSDEADNTKIAARETADFVNQCQLGADSVCIKLVAHQLLRDVGGESYSRNASRKEHKLAVLFALLEAESAMLTAVVAAA